jgi:hypothetical protein
MQVTKERVTEESFLGAIYKNVKMGSDSMVNIMDKVGDDGLRRELTAELDQYEQYSNEISKMIYDCGGKPKEENIVTKLGAKMGMAMNTLTDTTTSHLSEMVIQGATMGMTDMTTAIREYENKNCSESALRLARDIAEFEDKSVDKLKKFL